MVDRCVLRAESQQDLQKQLEGNIYVPRRGSRKAREHKLQKELFSIAAFLRCPDLQQFMAYPVEVWRREKPDFLLKMNGRDIGVEQTEAIPENQAQKDAIRNQRKDGSLRSSDPCLHQRPAFYFAEQHVPGERKKSRKELEVELQLDPHNSDSEGWADECEQVWAEVMSNKIRIKSEKVKGYKSCAEHWLLIYDNWVFPHLDIDEALHVLRIRLADDPVFDRIPGFTHAWILSGRDLCHVSFQEPASVASYRYDMDDGAPTRRHN